MGVFTAMFNRDLDVGSAIVGVPMFQFLFAIYLIPTHIALFRNHKSSATIFVINLLLGWICIGFIVSLAWCLYGIGTSSTASNATNQEMQPTRE